MPKGISYSHELSESGSPDTFTGHDDGVVAVTFPHRTGGFLARQATLVETGVLAAAHATLVHEVNSLRETLGQTQRTLGAVQALLLTFETSQTRTEMQIDLLIRMQKPVARNTFAAQTPPDQHMLDPDTA